MGTHKTAAILLATYNGAKHLPDFLESLCQQTASNIVIYARDDGSSDNTLEILNKYAAQLVIRILPADDRLGAALNFMRLLAVADADHTCYMFADQDDYWRRDKVELANQALRGNENDVALHCTRVEYVDERLNHLGLSRVPQFFTFENALVENVVTGCTIAITPRTRMDVLACRAEDRFIVMHDWWLYLFCSAFGAISYDANPSLKYRQHVNNTVGVATGCMQSWYRRLAQLFSPQYGKNAWSRQAESFRGCYGDRLSPDLKRLLDSFCAGVDSPRLRLLNFLSLPVRRQTRLDDWLFRFIYLIGRY